MNTLSQMVNSLNEIRKQLNRLDSIVIREDMKKCFDPLTGLQNAVDRFKSSLSEEKPLK